jgi:hypothetical protein
MDITPAWLRACFWFEASWPAVTLLAGQTK